MIIQVRRYIGRFHSTICRQKHGSTAAALAWYHLSVLALPHLDLRRAQAFVCTGVCPKLEPRNVSSTIPCSGNTVVAVTQVHGEEQTELAVLKVCLCHVTEGQQSMQEGTVHLPSRLDMGKQLAA